jgi:hypothetical protein
MSGRVIARHRCRRTTSSHVSGIVADAGSNTKAGPVVGEAGNLSFATSAAGGSPRGPKVRDRPPCRAWPHGGGDRSAKLMALSESPRDTAIMRYDGGLVNQWTTAINSRATVVDRRRDGAEGHAR